MKATCKLAILVGIFLLLTGSLTFARSKEKSAQVNLAFTTTLADGTTLPPGDYKVTLLNPAGAAQIVFYKGAKLLCKCPVKVEDAGTKISTTRIFYQASADNTHRITAMEIGGWTEKVTLNYSGS